MSASTKIRVVSQSAPLTGSVYSTLSPSKTSSLEVTNIQKLINFNLEIDGGISIAELLYRTNMIALVGSGTNPKWPVNKVFIWDDSKLDVIGELAFKTVIRGLKMVKDK